MFIYKVTNNMNGLKYVGLSRKDTLEERIYWYEKDIILKEKPNDIIKAMREFGFENFTFDILEDNITDLKTLNERERYWIQYYDTTNPEKGYNRDSGGLSGGTKSLKTKELIGKTTKEKWENPQTASKMLEGLKKGTETTKEKAKENYVTWNCLYCGAEMKGKPWEKKKYKFCSSECFGKYNAESGKAKEMADKAGIIKHENNIVLKSEIKETIVNWVKSNKKIVLTCPFNKITTTLKDLFELLENDYHLKDFRSYFICFEVKGRKEFLSVLKDIANKE